MLHEPTEWNLKGYTGFFWAGLAFLTAIWTFFRLPETKGRGFEDIDLMFKNNLQRGNSRLLRLRGLSMEKRIAWVLPSRCNCGEFVVGWVEVVCVIEKLQRYLCSQIQS
jgi:hypothetical protein